MGNNGNSEKLYFGGFQNHCRWWLQPGNKKMLPPWKKSLDTVLKSRGITLQTKICMLKVMFFLVVMYGCESWSIKKTEGWRIDVFELWCWRRRLSPPDFKEIKPVNQPWMLIGRDAEALILWPPDLKSQLIAKAPDAGKDWRQKEKGAAEDG